MSFRHYVWLNSHELFNVRKILDRLGNTHANIVPYQVFRTKEGEFIIACGNDQQFQMLCDSIGLPKISQNPQFVKNKDRVTHREEITALLQHYFMIQPTKYWVERIHAVKVPVVMINVFTASIRRRADDLA
ncbi:CoA transferase [Acinetobacter bouvetii]|uniref:CoA transferase n=1 Tax=Acinetobacter bouvetii TaxID=202951 RepID=UPI00269A4083